jgi:hypothetical protein
MDIFQQVIGAMVGFQHFEPRGANGNQPGHSLI